MSNIFQIISKAFKLVFKNIRYSVLAALFALGVYLLALLTHKAEFIIFVIKSELFDMATKFKLLFGTFLSIDTNFVSIFSFWIVVALAIIAGINIAMLIYLLRRQARASYEAGASLFGIVAGMLGIGCAACGSVILTTVFGLGFTVSLISFLPLDGAEFMIIALVVLVYSTYLLAKKIVNPMVCKPKTVLETL